MWLTGWLVGWLYCFLSGVGAPWLTSRFLKKISSLSFSHYTEEFFVGRNHLVGTVPSVLEANATSLQRLALSGNELTGAIPNLSGLTNLLELRLGRTFMTGVFPLECLDKITNLEVLELEHLSGDQNDLLPSLIPLTNLRILDFSGTRLFGTIPESIGNLLSLGKQR